MKRDMGLVREILLDLERRGENDKLLDVDDCAIEGHSAAEVGYHLRLMRQAGLVDFPDPALETMNRVRRVSMTWNAHEFLDSARSDTVWKKASGAIASKLGSVAFDVLLSYLKAKARETLGIESGT